MKKIAFYITLLLLLAAACGPDTQREAEDVREEVGELTDEVNQEIREEQKDLQTRVDQLRARLDDRIAELNARLDEASGSTKDEIEDRIAELEARRELLNEKAGTIGEEVKEGWSQIQGEIGRTIADIEAELEEE